MAVVFALAPRAFPAGRTLVPAVDLPPRARRPRPRARRLRPLGAALPEGRGPQRLRRAVSRPRARGRSGRSGPPRSSSPDRAGAGATCSGSPWPASLAAALAATGVVGSAAPPAEGRAGAGRRPSTRARRACRASRRSGSSRSWPCRAAASSTCGRPTRRPARGCCASEVFTDFDGRRWTNAARAGRSRRARSATILAARRRRRLVSGPLLADTGAWFPACRPPARRRRDEGGPRSRSSSTSRTWDAGPSSCPARVGRRDGGRALPGGGPIRQHPAARRACRFASTARGCAPRPRRSGASPLRRRPRARASRCPPSSTRGCGRSPAAWRPSADAARAAGRHRARTCRPATATRSRPGAFRTGDPLAEFLFEKKAGYCEYFASAAVVLLRLQGVPARFVKGLSVGPQTDQGGGLHVVRDSDAHAWVEAWIPGEGWVEADPTPPGQFAEAHGTRGLLPAVPPARARRAVRRRGPG